MWHLGEYLSTTAADVVLLQEVWVGADAEHLMACAARAGLVHGLHFKSGIFGAGLVTLSRHPIVESGFWRYSAAGDPAAVLCGDFYAAKGYGWVRIATPSGCVDVFNTHLHANYSHKCGHAPGALLQQHPSGAGSAHAGSKAGGAGGASSVHATATGCSSGAALAGGGSSSAGGLQGIKVPRDDFAAYRISQMCELAQTVRHVAKSGSVGVILGGDLNCEPNFLELALLAALVPELADSWEAVHGSEAGHTCAAPGNTFKSTGQPYPERIDYVLSTLPALDCRVALNLPTPAGCSYSDHFAVQARLALPSPEAPGFARTSYDGHSNPATGNTGRASASATLGNPSGAPGAQTLHIPSPRPQLGAMVLSPPRKARQGGDGAGGGHGASAASQAAAGAAPAAAALASAGAGALQAPCLGLHGASMLHPAPAGALMHGIQASAQGPLICRPGAFGSKVPPASVLPVLQAALQVLSEGVTINGRHALHRLLLGLVVALMAISWSVLLASGMFQPSYALVGSAFAALAAPVLAFAAGLLLVMGGVGDCTQQRVLQQGYQQLRLAAASVAVAAGTGGDVVLPQPM